MPKRHEPPYSATPSRPALGTEGQAGSIVAIDEHPSGDRPSKPFSHGIDAAFVEFSHGIDGAHAEFAGGWAAHVEFAGGIDGAFVEFAQVEVVDSAPITASAASGDLPRSVAVTVSQASPPSAPDPASTRPSHVSHHSDAP